MRVDLFDFDLPPERIALRPARPRDSARMLCVTGSTIEDATVRDLPSRLRRGELGHHHHIAGPYLVRYAQEAAWREDLRRVSNGEQTHGIVGLAMRSSPSVDFCGYWQRAQAS